MENFFDRWAYNYPPHLRRARRSGHYSGKLSAGENQVAAQRALVRTRAHMAQYRVAMLARKGASDD